jgi:hypothetical protein
MPKSNLSETKPISDNHVRRKQLPHHHRQHLLLKAIDLATVGYLKAEACLCMTTRIIQRMVPRKLQVHYQATYKETTQWQSNTNPYTTMVSV